MAPFASLKCFFSLAPVQKPALYHACDACFSLSVYECCKGFHFYQNFTTASALECFYCPLSVIIKDLSEFMLSCYWHFFVFQLFIFNFISHEVFNQVNSSEIENIIEENWSEFVLLLCFLTLLGM